MLGIYTLKFGEDWTTVSPNEVVSLNLSEKSDDSFIWTERYGSLGEFKIVSANVAKIKSQLTEGVLISHTQTDQVMRCETQEIGADSNGNTIITVTGYSLEGFLNYRPFMDPNTVPWPLPMWYQETLDSWQLPSSLGTLRPYKAANLMELLVQTSPILNDRIPCWAFTVNVRNDGDSLVGVKSEKINFGYLYDMLVEYLGAGNWALKSTTDFDNSQLLTTVHDGADHRNVVIFSAAHNDLVDPVYFWPGGTRRYAIARGHVNAYIIRATPGAPEETGFDRKYVFVERDNIDTGGSNGDLAALTVDAGIELGKLTGAVMLSTKISVMTNVKYKTNYDIGDLVTVRGDYNADQDMRVSEYILTMDKTGVYGYPSLTAI